MGNFLQRRSKRVNKGRLFPFFCVYLFASLMLRFLNGEASPITNPIPSNAPTSYPLWWFQQGVITPSNPTNASPSWPKTIQLVTILALSTRASLKILPRRLILTSNRNSRRQF